MLSPYLRRHLALTAAAHVVPAAALAALGFPVLGIASFTVGVALFVPLAGQYLRGERRARAASVYFVHWTAGLLALPLALPLVWSGRVGLALAYALALGLAAYGAVVGRRRVRLQRIEIAVANLPPELDGYRIAHVSDLHIGPWTPRREGMRWARAVGRLGCDLAVVTGDLIQTGDVYLEDGADVVGALRARDGIVFAMGNHDYYCDETRLVALLRARGVRVLRNASERLRGLLVAGVDHGRRGDLDAALAQRRAGEPAVLLVHDPDRFDEAAARGVDVVLSGHTHGGQLAVPFFARQINLARLRHRRSLGLYRSGKSQLLVHPGLGTSGPPVRIGAAPAIVEITLRRAA